MEGPHVAAACLVCCWKEELDNMLEGLFVSYGWVNFESQRNKRDNLPCGLMQVIKMHWMTCIRLTRHLDAMYEHDGTDKSACIDNGQCK